MVDLVREIKLVTLHQEGHLYITVGMGRDVEISRNSIDREVSFQLASMFLLNFFFHFVEEVHSILDAVKH